MNAFERLIDFFSTQNRRARRAAVIVVGIIACTLLIGIGALFFTQTVDIDIEGIGRGRSPETIAVSLDDGDIIRIPITQRTVEVQRRKSDGWSPAVAARIEAIELTEPTVLLRLTESPEGFAETTPYRLRLILERKPFWKLLWGQS